jgi:hypothetical protein
MALLVEPAEQTSSGEPASLGYFNRSHCIQFRGSQLRQLYHNSIWIFLPCWLPNVNTRKLHFIYIRISIILYGDILSSPNYMLHTLSDVHYFCNIRSMNLKMNNPYIWCQITRLIIHKHIMFWFISAWCTITISVSTLHVAYMKIYVFFQVSASCDWCRVEWAKLTVQTAVHTHNLS